MNTTTTKSIAMIDFEIEALKRKAHAERALELVGHDPGPLRGSAKHLQHLEVERDELALRQHGELLVALIDERAQLRREVDRLSAEHQRLQTESCKIEAGDTVQRFKRAPQVAAQLGSGWNWENYAKFLESRRPHSLIDPETFLSDWPDALKFTQQDRETLWRWRELQHAVVNAEGGRASTMGRVAEIERTHPELGAIP